MESPVIAKFTPNYLMEEIIKKTGNYREIKIHVYGKRQTSDLSWEFFKIENKQIKTVQNISYG